MDEVAETTIREGAADEAREAAAADQAFRRASRIAVPLTAVNGLLAAGCFGVWLIDRQAALALVRLVGPFGPLLGILGVGVGAWLHHRQKRYDKSQSTTLATVSLFVGMVAMTVFVLIQMSAAIESMIGPTR